MIGTRMFQNEVSWAMNLWFEDEVNYVNVDTAQPIFFSTVFPKPVDTYSQSPTCMYALNERANIWIFVVLN